MARRPLPRNVTPSMSDDPADKLYACMNFTIGHLTNKTGSYQNAPMYFDACWAWHESLTDDQKDYVLYVIDNFSALVSRPSAALPGCQRRRGVRCKKIWRMVKVFLLAIAFAFILLMGLYGVIYYGVANRWWPDDLKCCSGPLP